MKRISLKQLSIFLLLLSGCSAYEAAVTGNSSLSSATGPVITVDTVGLNIYTQSSIQFSGSCLNTAAVKIESLSISETLNVICTSIRYTANVNLLGPDGDKILALSAVSDSGVETRQNLRLVKDTTAPNLTFTNPAVNATVRGNVTVTGTCESGTSVSVAGADVAQPTSQPCVSSAFSVGIMLSVGDGTKTISIAQTDMAGNSASVSRSVIKNSTAPNLLVTQPTEGASFQNTVIVQGDCEPGLPVAVSGTGVTVAQNLTCVASRFNSTVTLTNGDGSKQIVFSQTNADNNMVSETRNVIKDTVGPVLTITAPAMGAFVTNTVTVTGTCESGIPVVLGGSGLTANANAPCTAGNFSGVGTLTAPQGDKIIQVSQTDLAGNSTAVTRTVQRDTVAPVLTITSPAANTVGVMGVTLVGTCETGLVVKVAGAGVLAPFDAACNAGAFNSAVNFSAGDGAKVVSISQTDLANNATTVTRSFVRGDPSVVQGQTLYSMNCAGCHGSIELTNKRGRSAPQIQSAIDQNIGGMGYLSTLNPTQIAQIAAALNAGGGAQPPPSNVDPNLAGSTSYSLMIGNVDMMTSRYLQAFSDPTSSSAENNNIRNIVKNLISDRTPSMGGYCNRYETNCPGGNQVDSSPIAKLNAVRKGYLIRACEEILTMNTAVQNALRLAALTESASATDTNVAAVYKMLLAGRNPSSESLATLRGIHQQALSLGQSTTDAWRYILLPICTSSNFDMI